MARRALVLLSVFLLALVALGGPRAGGREEQPEQFKLLVVDETRSFAASMAVELFARAVRRTGLFDLAARSVSVASSFDDPLRGQRPDRRYDIIVIVPRGVEDGTVNQVWIATRPFPEISLELRQAVALIKGIVNSGAQGRLRAVDVTDDALPGIFATIFIREGWL
ncbi:MAG: hypothetical protein NUW06_02485 [Candidatus Acetothermia bacterium]|nr:hypothetical protein [Candidatus Acetothermia bacterium]MDH7504566.1 hypothetical protein [Candidatus Acetothermia bacterium]